MPKCLSLLTQRSLLLIDEFGKGTDVLDSPAIFVAIVSVLAHTGACPRVISCTHFHGLFKTKILTTRIPGVIHYATEILLDSRDTSSSEDVIKENTGITFLYSIKEGISKQSFAIYCATICGIKPAIVKRAKQLGMLIDEGYDIAEQCERLTDGRAHAISNKSR